MSSNIININTEKMSLRRCGYRKICSKNLFVIGNNHNIKVSPTIYSASSIFSSLSMQVQR